MRNLELLGHNSFKVTSSEIQRQSFIAIDPESSTTYVAFEDDNNNIRVAATDLAPGDTTAFVEIGRCPASPIVCFTFLSDLEVVCLCTHNGDIMLFSKERFEKGEEAVMILLSRSTSICHTEFFFLFNRWKLWVLLIPVSTLCAGVLIKIWLSLLLVIHFYCFRLHRQ